MCATRTQRMTGLLLLVLASIPRTSAFISERSFNITAALELPPCVQTCGQQILPIYNCLLGDPCYCNRTGPVTHALNACVAENCTSLSARLAGAKFTADTCHYPKDDLGPTTRITANTLFALSSLFVFARMLNRWKKISGAGYWWDDFVVGLCYVPTVGFFVVTHFTVKNGSGQNVWEITVPMLTRYLQCFLTSQVIVFFVTFGTRISLCFLYLRIWSIDWAKGFRLACKITIVVLLGAMTSSCLTVIFSCRPLDAYWKLWLRPTSHCVDPTNLHYAYAGINMTLDLVVLGLPIPRLMKLQISLPQKLGVIATFMVGILVTFCSIMRVYYLYETYGTTNVTHDFSLAGLWGVIELNASMITCCMPPTAGLIKRLWRKAFKPFWSKIRSPTVSRTDSSGRTYVEQPEEKDGKERDIHWSDREMGGSWSERVGSSSRNDSSDHV